MSERMLRLVVVGEPLVDIVHRADVVSLGALLRASVRAAAITVSRPGADPPRRADLAISAGNAA